MTEKLFSSDGCRFSQATERSWLQLPLGTLYQKLYWND